MSTIPIPLSKLVISPRNIRHPVEGDLANDVHDLQASILAHGLMNPPTVHRMSKPRGMYGVIAGGRRLRALQGLAADGRIPADHLVDCTETHAAPEMMTEMSIAENIVRVALKPTAEFEAFARLAAEGVDEEKIAERYATTVMHVRQRMRLGRLHPDILSALDANRITLDIAKAYAATADQALQIRVFTEMAGGHSHWPQNIRNAIRGGGAAVDADRMLAVVGEEAYRSAGGHLEEDLFTGHKRVLHPGTLNDLYYAELAAQEAAFRATVPEHVEIATSPVDLGRHVFVAAELAPEQHDRLVAIDRRADAIHEQLEAIAEIGESDDPDVEPAIVADRPRDQAKVDALRAELGELQDEGEAIHAAASKTLPDGPLVAWVEPGEGGMTLRGYYRPRGYVEAGSAAAGAGSGDPGEAPKASLDRPIGLYNRIGWGDPDPHVKAEHGLTVDAIQVMRSHRRAILRGMMLDAQEPYARKTAGLLLTFSLLRLTAQGDGLGRVHYADLGIALGAFRTAPEPNLPGLGTDFECQPCVGAWEAALGGIAEADWMTEPDLRAAFNLFVELDDREQERLHAVAAGMMLDRALQAPGYRVPLHDELAALIGTADGLTIRQRYWTPDDAFFEQLPKTRRLAAVEEVAPGIAREIAKLPTADIAAACALFFSATPQAQRRFAMLPGHVAHAKRWVPAFLAFSDEPRGPRLVETELNRAVARSVAA